MHPTFTHKLLIHIGEVVVPGSSIVKKISNTLALNTREVVRVALLPIGVVEG